MTDFVKMILSLVLQSIKNKYSIADYVAWDLEMYLPSPQGQDPLFIKLFKGENEQKCFRVKGFQREVVLTFNGNPIEYNGKKVSYFKKSFFNPVGTWITDSDMLQVTNTLLAIWHRDIEEQGYIFTKRSLSA